MPAPLHQDAVAYLKQNNQPINTQSLNRTMQLLGQRSDLRPSYSNVGNVNDIDMDTMRPIQSSPLPPLSSNSNTQSPSSQSFGQAFAAARKKFGATGEFEYKGKRYNTKYKDEVGSETPNKTPNINKDAEAEMQSDLANEEIGDNSMDSIAPNETRRNLTKNENDDEMENLLAALGVTAGGAAAVAGGAYAANRMRNRPQKMQEGDLNAPEPKNRSMSDEDLYGKRPQSMTDEDLFFDEEMRKMVDGDIQMSMQDEFEHSARTGEYVDEEVQAVEALRKKDKAAAKKLLPQLKQLGGDKRLITALKALL